MRLKPRVRAASKQPVVAAPNRIFEDARLRLLPRATAALETTNVVALALEAEEGGHAAEQPQAQEVLVPPAETAQAHEHREPDGRGPLAGQGRAARER